MTQLQKIVAKAKTLKKSHPNTKWTDLIKKASKLVTPASKSVGANKKKKAVVKKAVVKKYAPVKPLAKKKKALKKSPARSMHKDTKSHNVNIRVMSGMEKTNRYIKDIENRIQLIKKHEREIEIVKEWMTRHDPYRTLSDKNMMKKEILELKQAISLYKHDIKILKKFIK
jgi:hypothetical protein